MCAPEVIVQQKEQNIKKFRWLRTLAIFHQFGLQNYVTVSITSICNSNGKILLAIFDEKKCTTSLLSPRPCLLCDWYSKYLIVKFQ